MLRRRGFRHHGPVVAALSAVAKSGEFDRPQVLTPDGFVLWRTGAYKGWPTALRQQIVPAAPSDGSPNEFANRRRLRQDDARIDIRSVPLAAGDVRLIHQKSQFAPSFFASYIVGDLLLHG